jgi:hypothetical protein
LICPAGKSLSERIECIHKEAFFFDSRSSVSMFSCDLRAKCLRIHQAACIRQVAYYRPHKGRGDIYPADERKIPIRQGYTAKESEPSSLFWFIRHILKLNRFTMRGKRKEHQWKLFSIVHNLIKIHRFGLALTVFQSRGGKGEYQP